MFEKVNPRHPDKIADRIAGAIVDLAYKIENNPKVAVEVLIGHGNCWLIIESSVDFRKHEESILGIVIRITKDKDCMVKMLCLPQDKKLAENQEEEIKCGDNGIFKGAPITSEEQRLTDIAYEIYKKTPQDGKYILDDGKLIICQSCIKTSLLKENYPKAIINPIGDWSGGLNVDSGATNRKLGSDMGRSITGGGLHGKDLSKADVSINIYCFLKAQETQKPYEVSCAIGDSYVDGKKYSEIVEIAREYINSLGGFEKFAEWGLIRPKTKD